MSRCNTLRRRMLWGVPRPPEPLLFPNMTVEETLATGLDEPRATSAERAVAQTSVSTGRFVSRQANSPLHAGSTLVENTARAAAPPRRSSSRRAAPPRSPSPKIQSLFKLIKELRAEGGDLLHHPICDEVFESADPVAILARGRVTHEGRRRLHARSAPTRGCLPSESRKGTLPHGRNPPPERPDAKPGARARPVTGTASATFRSPCNRASPRDCGGRRRGRPSWRRRSFGIGKLVGGRELLMARTSRVRVRDAIRRGANYIPERPRRETDFSARRRASERDSRCSTRSGESFCRLPRAEADLQG
jgi:AI-2 transport system ATP-binding protein